MTEKRFTIIYNEQCKMMQYIDNQKEEPNRWAIWNASETAQKLNQLNDENEQLKENIADWETSFDLLKHENEELKKDILRLMYTAEHLVNIEKLEEKWSIDYNQFVSDLMNGDEHL